MSPSALVKTLTIKGATIIPIITTKAVKKETRVRLAEIKSWVVFRPSSVLELSKYSLNVGIKATDTLFSANNRRNKFGIVKAIPKASAKAVVPKKSAFVASRITPSIRENNVMNESFTPEANKDFFSFFFIYNMIALLLILFNPCRIFLGGWGFEDKTKKDFSKSW